LKLAEDAEWAYRALRLGVPIAFDPRPVVTHLAWRDAAARAVTYRGYVNSSGAFYGVYLRRGDWFLGLRAAYDLTRGVWMWLRGIMTGSADLAAYGRAYLTELLPGVWTGLRLP
jgi:GT2 family glycosyltransferase